MNLEDMRTSVTKVRKSELVVGTTRETLKAAWLIVEQCLSTFVAYRSDGRCIGNVVVVFGACTESSDRLA